MTMLRKFGWAKYVPALYHQQWVAIENFRLWVVQTIAYILIAVGVVYVLYVMPDYNSNRVPHIRHSLWVGSTASTVGANPSYCSAGTVSSMFNYRPVMNLDAANFQGSTCAQVTDTVCSAGVECIQKAQVSQSEPHSLFIATAYTKEVFDATTGTTTQSSHIIPGVEDVTVGVSVDFQIDPPLSLVFPLMGMDMVPSSETQIVMVDSMGKIPTQYVQDKVNRMNTVTVRQLIDMSEGMVSLDAPITGMLSEFPDNPDPATPAGLRRPKARVTGLDIVLSTQLDNTFGGTDFGGLTARITSKATPTWNTQTSIAFTDDHGSTETRVYYGIRIGMKHRGKMSWFQLNEVIYTWSLYSAWLQIPFYFIFYFAVCCLGTLSTIFQGFLYESVDLHQEFNGTSARMLELTYGFHDLHDAEEKSRTVWGVTRQRLQNRVDVILEHDKNLCKAERTQFTNYIFDMRATPMPTGSRGIHLDDYRASHMANENLLFKDVLQIVDSDRSSGNILERLFMDDSLKEFSATDEKAEQKIMGKVKAKHLKSNMTAELEQRLEKAKSMRTIKQMGRINTIARCKYGLEIADELMGKLEGAVNKMRDTCDTVEHKGQC